jgi:hypothetical protein
VPPVEKGLFAQIQFPFHGFKRSNIQVNKIQNNFIPLIKLLNSGQYSV